MAGTKDALVDLGVNSINAVYVAAPPPEGDEERAPGKWEATVSVQGNPYAGEGATFQEAVDAAVKAYNERPAPESPEPAPQEATK